MLSPKKTRFYKQHKGRMKGISYRGNFICFGKYALKALEPAWITSKQLEAGRSSMIRNIPHGAKIWVRLFPDKPVTVKPKETRMGSGKGSLEHWVTVVKPGKILYEINEVTENIARKCLLIVASKMPLKTKFFMDNLGKKK